MELYLQINYNIMKTKFGRSHYYKPTPKKWRKLGDALLVIGGTITAAAMTGEILWLQYTALTCTVLGKTLTNFFTEEE